MSIKVEFTTLPKNPSRKQIKLFFKLRIKKLEECLKNGSVHAEDIKKSIDINKQYMKKLLE